METGFHPEVDFERGGTESSTFDVGLLLSGAELTMCIVNASLFCARLFLKIKF